MSDLINRQDAIDSVEESRRLNHHQDGKTACAHEYEHKHFLKILRELPSAQPEIIRCKDCKWGREVCGNIECFVDSNIPPEYHGYEWFCPNGEKENR